MLDDFDDIRLRELILFDRLLALGSLTAAAQELGVPKPTASRWLAGLEQRVGNALVHRVGRQLTATEQGLAFRQQLEPVLGGLRALRAAGRGDRPGGTLRVSVPVPFGRLLGGLVIARFAALMPGVRLEVLLQNKRVDLLRDRVDLAIRGGPLPDSSLVARPLALVPLWLYRSAVHANKEAYRVPLIAAPGDEAMLSARHSEILPAGVVVDDRTAVRDALRAGAGQGVLPAFLGEPFRRAGHLVRTEDTPLAKMRVHAVFLPEQRKDPRVRALVDLIQGEVGALLGEGDP
jgi:DNA-binding transcriptional LysR family regulator